MPDDVLCHTDVLCVLPLCAVHAVTVTRRAATAHTQQQRANIYHIDRKFQFHIFLILADLRIFTKLKSFD